MTGLHTLEDISLEKGERIELLSNEQGEPQVLIHSRSGITEIRSLVGQVTLADIAARSKIILLQDKEAKRDRRLGVPNRRDAMTDRRKNRFKPRRGENLGRGSKDA